MTTTYNEVANILVIEALKLFDGEPYPDKKMKDHEKNIRRRVYDALNVLLATDIISKTKEKGDREKSIHWRGYPSSSSVDLIMLQKEKEAAIAEIAKKKECLKELLVQNVCFRNLETRNKRYKLDEKSREEDKIALPFIVVNTAENAVIQCEMNPEKTDVMFDFNMPFEINDDNEILKRLGLSHASYEDLEKLLPKDIFQYCREHRLLDAVLHHPNYHAYPYYQPHPAHPHVHPAHGHVHPAHGHGHAHPQGHGLPGHPPTIASLPPSHAYAHAHPDSSASGTGAMSEANRAAEAKAGYDARTATAAATSEYPPSHPRAYPTR